MIIVVIYGLIIAVIIHGNPLHFHFFDLKFENFAPWVEFDLKEKEVLGLIPVFDREFLDEFDPLGLIDFVNFLSKIS